MDAEMLNTADYFIIAIVGLSVIISLMRGFVREALSLASWVIAIWVAFTFYPSLAELVKTYIRDQYIAIGVAFFLLFAASLILGSMISYLLSRVILVSGLGGTDRLLGGIFGFVRGALLIAILILFAGMTNFQEENWWKTSTLIPKFTPVSSWLAEFLPLKEQSLLAQSSSTEEKPEQTVSSVESPTSENKELAQTNIAEASSSLAAPQKGI